MTAAKTGVRRRSDRLASENRRYAISTGVGFVVAIAVMLPWVGARDAAAYLTAAATGAMAALDVVCVVYIGLTVRAFAGVPATELPDLVRPQPVATWLRVLRGGSDGPTVAVQYAVVALLAAAVLPRLDLLVADGRSRAVLVVLCVLGVGLCWALLTVSYAVHYVRIHTREGGLAFPGPEQPTFGDYVYYAVAVGTTLGTTDVHVDRRHMRRVVTVHALIAFAFNTVILALVLSALTA